MYLSARQPEPGLLAVGEHLPQRHAKHPHIWGMREGAHTKALWGAPGSHGNSCHNLSLSLSFRKAQWRDGKKVGTMPRSGFCNYGKKIKREINVWETFLISGRWCNWSLAAMTTHLVWDTEKYLHLSKLRMVLILAWQHGAGILKSDMLSFCRSSWINKLIDTNSSIWNASNPNAFSLP